MPRAIPTLACTARAEPSTSGGSAIVVEDAARDADRGFGAGDVLDEDRELVAPEPGAGVLGAEAALQALRGDDEQLVAGRMAEAVVHGLEVVEVDEEDGEEVLPAHAALERVADPVREEGAVREAGQRVVEGLVRELLLELPAVGHVAGGDHHARDVRVVEEVVEDALELARGAVLAAERQVAVHRESRRLADPREEDAERLHVARVEHVREPGADELVLAVPEDAPDRRRVVADRQVRREEGDDVARVLDERAEALGALALVDVRGQRSALEREGDLGRERLEPLASASRQLLARVDDERASGLVLHLEPHLHDDARAW